MTQVDTFGVYVRAELEHWGREFALHRDCEYLGHRSKDMLALLIEHGGEMPPRVTGFKPMEFDLRAQRIEDAIADIARWNVERASIMRGYYCGLGAQGLRAAGSCRGHDPAHPASGRLPAEPAAVLL